MYEQVIHNIVKVIHNIVIAYTNDGNIRHVLTLIYSKLHG